MSTTVIAKSLRCGLTPDESEPPFFSIDTTATQDAAGAVDYRVQLSGPLPVDKQPRGRDAFDAARMGMAALRQILRMLQQRHPGLKYYEDIDGIRVEQTVEDIFWVHDCVPERSG